MYGEADRARLGQLFTLAAIPLMGSLLAISLASTGLAMESTYLWVSALSLSVIAVYAIAFSPGAYRAAVDPDANTEPWALVVGAVFALANFLLLGGNVLLGGKAWPLISAFSSQLVFGLWIFTRILTRRG